MKQQSGNALFLILIAVALFAALSYAITQSGRGGQGIDKEQAGIAAAQLAQYAAQIEQAIMRMQIAYGCSNAEISFYHDSNGNGTIETDGSDVYYNANSPTPDKCHVFSNEGGSIVYQAPDDSWLDGTNTAAFGYGEIFVTGSATIQGLGTTQGDLILFIPYISEAVCTAIVKNFQERDTIPVEDTNAWATTYFTGTYAGSRTVDHKTGTGIDGYKSGCFEGDVVPSGGYHFWHGLIIN